MVLGSLQAANSINQYSETQKAIDKGHQQNRKQYQSAGQGLSMQADTAAQTQHSKADIFKSMGNYTNIGAQGSADIAMDLSTQMQGAQSNYLNQKAELEGMSRKSQMDLGSNLISSTTLMTQGMSGGPRVMNSQTGLREMSFDPRWGGLGGWLQWDGWRN